MLIMTLALEEMDDRIAHLAGRWNEVPGDVYMWKLELEKAGHM